MSKINKNKLDPITIYETNKIELILTREELALPERDDEDDDEEETPEAYKERLIQVSTH